MYKTEFVAWNCTTSDKAVYVQHLHKFCKFSCFLSSNISVKFFRLCAWGSDVFNPYEISSSKKPGTQGVDWTSGQSWPWMESLCSCQKSKTHHSYYGLKFSSHSPFTYSDSLLISLFTEWHYSHKITAKTFSYISL